MFDENIDHSNWILLGYVIFQAAAQERLLRPFFRLHELTHSDVPQRDLGKDTRSNEDTRLGKGVSRFYTAWVASGRCVII